MPVSNEAKDLVKVRVLKNSLAIEWPIYSNPPAEIRVFTKGETLYLPESRIAQLGRSVEVVPPVMEEAEAEIKIRLEDPVVIEKPEPIIEEPVTIVETVVDPEPVFQDKSINVEKLKVISVTPGLVGRLEIKPKVLKDPSFDRWCRIQEKVNNKEKIRLLLVMSSTHIGGAEIQGLRLFQNLDPELYDLTLLTFEKGRGLLNEEFEKVCSIDYLIGEGGPLGITFKNYVESHDFDIVHFILFEQFYPKIPAFNSKIVVIVTIFRELSKLLEYDKFYSDRYYLNPAIYERVDAWITDSKANQEILPHINVIPFGVESDLFNGDYSEKRKNTVSWVSRLADNKRVGKVLLLARCLPEFEFNIVCALNTDESRKNYSEMMENASPNVSFYANLDREEVANVLRFSQYFIITSETESLSVSMMEAMMCGCTPIVPDIGDLARVLNHGVDGYVYDGEMDIDALADEVKQYKFLGIASREKALRLWDVRARVRNIEFLYGVTQHPGEKRVAFVTTYAYESYDYNFWRSKRDSIEYAIGKLSADHSVVTFLPHSEKVSYRCIVNGYGTFFYDRKNIHQLFKILDKFNPTVLFLKTLDWQRHRPLIERYPLAYKTVFEYGAPFKQYKLFHKIDKVLIQQRFRVEECMDTTEVDWRKVIVCTYGVDPSKFKPLPSKKEYNAVLVADFRPKIKRNHLIIEAWKDVPGKLLLLARVNQPGIYGEYELKCRGIIEELDLGDRVIIQDFVPHAELPQLLNKCKIGIMTSSREAGSRAQVEMLACGLPVVVMSDCEGAVNNMMRDEGLISDPEPVAIATAVNSLLNNERQLISRGMKASNRVREELSYETMYKILDKTIQDSQLEVSVITTSYNKGPFIGECIESVLMQNHPGVKINHVIVDAGSTDETFHVLTEYAGRVNVYVNEGQSQTESLNWAMKKINEDFPNTKLIGWINADDKYKEGWLSESLKLIWDYDLTSSQYDLINREGDLQKANVEPWGAADLPDKIRIEDFIKKNTIVQPTILMRRECFNTLAEETGFHWNPEYEYTQDYELWIRWLMYGFTIIRLRKSLACLRHFKEQMSNLRKKEQKADFDKLQSVFE